MKKLACFLIVSSAFAGCTAEEPPVQPPAADPQATQAPESAPQPEPAAPVDPFSDPQALFAHQYERLREVDVEGVRACMVEAARADVDPEQLRLAKERMRSVPVGDIAAEIVRREDEADVVMKSGAVLTTLIREGGKWYVQEPWWEPKR